jgi:hypothetical protein
VAIETLQERAKLVAQAHVMFRDINDQLAQKRTHSAKTRMGFLCECADRACIDQVGMTGEEYQRLRASPFRFAVLPDEQHVSIEIEWIASVEDGYWIVEQSPDAGRHTFEEREA